MARTLLEFFVDEATDYLDKLEEELSGDAAPDADRLRRLGRALRGSARMADQEAIARSANAVQGVAADLAAGRRHWEPELARRLELALTEIREMVNSVNAPAPGIDERAEALVEHLGQAVAPQPPARDDERFRRYLGTELRGLASDIGDAAGVLERDPRNREPLKRLLRRIRPLRGISGVDDIPGVGAALAAVEEVILRIADTSATVGPGHLVLFRRARQALEDVATDLIRGTTPAEVQIGRVEIDYLKDQVLDTAAQREVTWISELFPDEPGPHIEDCPMADRGAGSWEAFFTLEATGSLDTADRLRAEMARDLVAARPAGEQLAFVFRQLRERAVTFGHVELGRVARRAAAAVRAVLDAPPQRLQAIAVDLAVTVGALRDYIVAEGSATRARAVQRAEASLHMATQRPEEGAVSIESLVYSPEDALRRARRLRDDVGVMLRSGQIDVGLAHRMLEEALDLIEHSLERGGPTV